MSPWVAALPLFFAARALPLSLRTFLAPSTSPSDSSSARFTSIIPAAVSSRSCLIFSIVLAKAPTSPRSLRSPHHRTPQRRRPPVRQAPAPQPRAPRRPPGPRRAAPQPAAPPRPRTHLPLPAPDLSQP